MKRAFAWLLLPSFAVTAAAQSQRVEEFLQLEPVLQAAIAKAAPFTVTVETFGGTRQLLGKDGEFDGEAPPPPKPAPEPPKPDSEPPAPEQPDPLEPEPPDGEKKDAPPKLRRQLVAPGFAQAQGKTTGVVLTADGWIAVSRFALALEPTTVLITVPGRGTFTAQRAGEDTSRGIALVKIDATDLPVPELVPPDEVQVGQWALALGRTFAADEPTLHFGIVSQKRRVFGRALQIDAYTSPANYGGPVVDVRGRLLGIAVPLSPSGRNAGVEWYDSGIGFAVTLADIAPLLARMQKGEVLQRGWLGVLFEGRHLGPGARITSVVAAGAAAEAGLLQGDVVIEVDGQAVRNGPHLLTLVSSRLGGDQVVLRVRRGDPGEVVTIGPLALRNAPWTEQKQGGGDAPAGFPAPQPSEGR
ncbi:MAG: S1C family serine protease [Planctomycetes bacterium]|jgi:S1-C subfamily serine protease|nr:S1C family serine protease [Planctomycetota bacterium]